MPKRTLLNGIAVILGSVWLIVSAFSPAISQESPPLALETISAVNLDRLETLAAWQLDDHLLSNFIHVTPAKNADIALIENRFQNLLGAVDIAQQQMLPTFTFDSPDTIFHAAISPNGQFGAVSDLKVIDIWTISTGEKQFRIAADQNFEVNAIDFSVGSDFFAYTKNAYPASSDQDGVFLYNLATNEQISFFPHPTATLVKFSPNGNYLISIGYDGSVRLWKLQTAEFIELRPADEMSVLEVNFVNADLVALSLDDSRYLRNVMEYWNIAAREQVMLPPERVFSDYLVDGVSQIRQSDRVSFQLWSICQDADLAFLPNANLVLDVDTQNNLVITGGENIEFHRLDTGELLHIFSSRKPRVLQFTSSRKYLISWYGTGYVEIWGVPQTE